MLINWKLIGTRVKESRELIGITQSELAEHTDLSVSYISHIERGTRKGSLESLLRITDELGITMNEILYGNQTNDKTEYQTDMDIILEDCNCAEKRMMYLIVRLIKEVLRSVN